MSLISTSLTLIVSIATFSLYKYCGENVISNVLIILIFTSTTLSLDAL